MFTNMSHIKTECYSARNSEYELKVYLVKETGEHKIFISSTCGSVGNTFSESDEAVRCAKLANNNDIVEKLIALAKLDIERNEFGEY